MSGFLDTQRAYVIAPDLVAFLITVALAKSLCDEGESESTIWSLKRARFAPQQAVHGRQVVPLPRPVGGRCRRDADAALRRLRRLRR